MANEQLTADLASHAAGEQFVTQANPVKLVEALEAVDPFDDLDVRGHRFQRV
ncbi:hypothetical protein D3C79_811510 [compost metagenome]